MTTAHRPTWAPAKGHEEQGGARMFGPSKKHSKLDDNAHMTLKTRAVGQMSVKELIARDAFGLRTYRCNAPWRAGARGDGGGGGAVRPTVARARASRPETETPAFLGPWSPSGASSRSRRTRRSST